jgi:hypothetical protein
MEIYDDKGIFLHIGHHLLGYTFCTTNLIQNKIDWNCKHNSTTHYFIIPEDVKKHYNRVINLLAFK